MWTVPSHRLIIDGGSYAPAIEYLAAGGLKKFTSHEKKKSKPKTDDASEELEEKGPSTSPKAPTKVSPAMYTGP